MLCRTARQEGFEGRNAVLSSFWFFGAGGGVRCGSFPPIEPQASYHNRTAQSGPLPLPQSLWRVRRQSVRLIAEPTDARREERLMEEAKVDRFSMEVSG